MASVEELKNQLQGAIDQARRRLQSMQEAAAEHHRTLQARYQQFLKSAERIRALLQPRTEAFESTLKGAHKSISRLDYGEAEDRYHGTIVTFEFPHTPECPADLRLQFKLSHDESIEHLVLTYDLEMTPVFIQFKKHDQFISPVDNPDEQAAADWFDRCALEFTRTFVEMQFNPQYQEENLTRDVVLGFTFPRAFAVGKVESGGSTYDFFTEDSLREFQEDPERFKGTPAETKEAG